MDTTATNPAESINQENTAISLRLFRHDVVEKPWILRLAFFLTFIALSWVVSGWNNTIE
jgi:hypothetical protein